MVRSRPADRPVLLDGPGLEAILGELRRLGHTVLGPVRRGAAIGLGELRSLADLPAGWGDEQAPGRYRLRRRDDDAWFGWAVGPDSWRRVLTPPSEVLWRARRDGRGFEVVDEPVEPRPLALVGVRPCDLSAIGIQQRVVATSPEPDRRIPAPFVAVVECGAPAATCFCASTGDGPGVAEDAAVDLVLTELVEPDRHVLVARARSELGAEVLAAADGAPADDTDLDAAATVVRDAAASQVRALPDVAACRSLADRPEHPRWVDVAGRCLSCGSCTLVCPTCFCASIADHTDLGGDEAWREARWDSCFSLDHSFIHGGSIRHQLPARYRQWLTHKVATWWDQFGTSGCVGCGRCLTWCPAAIDLTEEVAAISGAAAAPAGEEVGP
jgi:ferredoxin